MLQLWKTRIAEVGLESMRAYSIEIRERVIENLEQESMRKTAKRFRVSEYFVYQLKQRYKEAGTLAPKPHGGGHGPIVDEGGGEFIRGVLAEAADLTLKELCERYEGRFGRAVSKSSMDRALRRLKVTRKKRLATTPSKRASVSNRSVRPIARNYRP
jgi:transposase